MSAQSVNGILPDHAIAALMAQGAIAADLPFDGDQLQPASLDLRLGSVAYRIRASFLPGAGRVEPRLAELALHQMDLTQGAVLERGCVYLVPLLERLALPTDLTALANPKSSTGRIDVFVRMIADGARAFDTLEPSAQGGHQRLWLEIAPCTFSILARTGDRLAQLRLRRGPRQVRAETTFSIDLRREGPQGFRARRHTGLVDLRRLAAHRAREYWEPVHAEHGALVLDPGEFYILASLENIEIAPEHAAEMAPIAPELGEFRAHYAGFFDPGFGTGHAPSRAVLEVRSRDVAFLVEHGQPVGKLVHEPLTSLPNQLYGGQGSNYQGQGLKLSKHFAPW